MRQQRRHTPLFLLAFLGAALSVANCGGGGGGDGNGDGDGDGDGDGSGSGSSDNQTTGGCVNEACDPPDDEPGPCPDAAELTYPMSHTGGPSMCQGYGPDECSIVDQAACSVTVECEGFGALTVAIDAEGVSDDVSVPIGDGIVAECHVEVGTEGPPSLTVVCSAQGITCEWAGAIH